METLYLRHNMPKVESELEILQLYEWFGEQNNCILKMSGITFDYLLKKLNINPNERILVFNELQFLFGYRIIIDEEIKNFYIEIYDFYELTK